MRRTRGGGRRVPPGAILLIAWLVVLGAGARVPVAGRSAAPAQPPASDPLVERGIEITGGAAPGYVADRRCATCHPAIAQSYEEVAMSRSLRRADDAPAIEVFARFYHEPSQRFYEMTREEGGYLFRRFQIDDGGRPINLLERPVDWILGSGNHARTYLFQTDAGELFQLPIAWYTRTGQWGMAPGYDRPDHVGVGRLVRRQCLFCHNAYPDVPDGSDARHRPDRFPAALPEGIGCQRCHGPGAEHLRRALATTPDVDAVRAAIVNPARLAPARRTDVCYQCHLQPSVALISPERFGRGIYSFRPGETLADYRVALDVVEADRPPRERFEINHHPYRLEQSRCFLESEGALSCLTCHDPHRKVAPADQAAHYRARCLTCHEAASVAAHTDVAASDCVSCHMPQRRPTDVVQVTMTDHLIQRPAAGDDPLRMLPETTPVVLDALLWDDAAEPDPTLRDVYRAVGAIRSRVGIEAVSRLDGRLAELELAAAEPHLDLMQAALTERSLDVVDRHAEAVARLAPDDPLLIEFLGLARTAGGQVADAIDLLRRAAAADVPRAEAPYNLGVTLIGADRLDDALAPLQTAVALRPTFAAAWFQLGRVQLGLGETASAVDSLTTALAIDPTLARAYVALAEALVDGGDPVEAARYVRHGLRVVPPADRPALTQALAALLSRP